MVNRIVPTRFPECENVLWLCKMSPWRIGGCWMETGHGNSVVILQLLQSLLFQNKMLKKCSSLQETRVKPVLRGQMNFCRPDCQSQSRDQDRGILEPHWSPVEQRGLNQLVMSAVDSKNGVGEPNAGMCHQYLGSQLSVKRAPRVEDAT